MALPPPFVSEPMAPTIHLPDRQPAAHRVSCLPMFYLPVLLFTTVYAAAALAWHLPAWIGIDYLLASVVCFIAYALDKAAARSRSRRTPERTLLLLGLVGGWPGAVLAQQWLRHKSVKASFQAKFWVTAVLNVAAFVAGAAHLGGRL